MKAIFWQGGKKFELGDAPPPKPRANQVLLKVEAASICTSDFHYEDWDCKPPIIPGHEVAGTVIELGKDVRDVRKGWKVAVDPVQRCGVCELCRAGIGHLCPNTRHLGNSANPGGWAEYLAVDAANIYQIPENVSMVEAAMTEPTAVCMESFERAKFQPGQNILIFGDGVFGFIHAMFARILGANNIIVAGHYDQRLSRIAKKTGAIICNTHTANLEDVIVKVAGNLGVHLAIEATSSGAAPNLCLKALRPRGTLVLFSYIWKPEILDVALVNMKELNVLGSCRSLNCFAKCLRLMAEKKLDIEALADVQVPLAEYKKAISGLSENKKNVFKAVLLP
ncbi:MAG: alcohol dehydrogenase catalytic domain-containing protein [Sedimentisphaerales bacterium]